MLINRRLFSNYCASIPILGTVGLKHNPKINIEVKLDDYIIYSLFTHLDKLKNSKNKEFSYPIGHRFHKKNLYSIDITVYKDNKYWFNLSSLHFISNVNKRLSEEYSKALDIICQN